MIMNNFTNKSKYNAPHCAPRAVKNVYGHRYGDNKPKTRIYCHFT